MRDHERVRAQLTAALNAMNGAADASGAAPGAAAPPYAAYGDYGPAGAAYVEPSPGTGAAAAAEPSLRQLVEQYAADAGVAFLPKAGRRHEGLQARSLVIKSRVPMCDGSDELGLYRRCRSWWRRTWLERATYLLNVRWRTLAAGAQVTWFTCHVPQSI